MGSGYQDQFAAIALSSNVWAWVIVAQRTLSQCQAAAIRRPHGRLPVPSCGGLEKKSFRGPILGLPRLIYLCIIAYAFEQIAVWQFTGKIQGLRRRRPK